MNDNYHTQLAGHNILNEVAANNHLLQTFQPKQQQFQPAPQPYISPLPQAPQYTPPQQFASQKPLPISEPELNLASELQLSDKPPQPSAEKATQLQQINQQVAELIKNPEKPPAKAAPIEKAPVTAIAPKPKPTPPAKRQSPQVVVVKQPSPAWKYAIIPLLIIIAYMLVSMPKTAGFFDKVLPSVGTLKGYAARGAIIAIVYLAAILMAK